MSYDLKFWKDVKRRGIKAPKPSDTYTRLNDGETLPHVAELPTQEILDRLIELFPDFEPEGTMREIELPDGNIEVSWGPQHFRIDLRGDADEAAGQIVTLMSEFGCRVYDPQTGKRHPLNKPTPWHAPADPRDRDSRGEKPPTTSAQLKRQLNAWIAERKSELEAMVARMEKEDPEGYRAYLEERDAAAKREQEAIAAKRNEPWEIAVATIMADIERDCPNGRWRRLGLTPRTLAAVQHNADATVKDLSGDTHDFGQLKSLGFQLDDRFRLACLGFLEAIPVASPWADWRASARHAAALAEPYFYGPLRDGYKKWPDEEPLLTREQARAKLEWIRVYRTCLLCALLVDDESSLSRVLAWPDTDLPVDDDLGDLTAMDNKYHIYLAMRLRGDPLAKFEPVAKVVRTGKRPRAALLLESAEAALVGDEALYAEKLKHVLSNWRKTLKPDEFRVVSIEGSILWHVARRRGLALPELPEKLADLVLR